MSYEQAVSDHYLHGSLTNVIEATLQALGKTIETVTIADLAAVDEFHIGGRVATDNLIEQLDLSKKHKVLDIGCGLGGASRYVATKFKSHVTGIDLTPEYVETGKVLCKWLNLDRDVTLEQGSALAMPFEDCMFDKSYMLHVGMNIDDKLSLFSEIHRVLKPGASFGIYDIMRQKEGTLHYPVPWASDSSTSKLSTPEQYIKALTGAGFEFVVENNRRDFAMDFFKQVRAKTLANGGPPPLGLHILMQQGTAEKMGNMIKNITENLIAPIEIIVKKI